MTCYICIYVSIYHNIFPIGRKRRMVRQKRWDQNFEFGTKNGGWRRKRIRKRKRRKQTKKLKIEWMESQDWKKVKILFTIIELLTHSLFLSLFLFQSLSSLILFEITSLWKNDEKTPKKQPEKEEEENVLCVEHNQVMLDGMMCDSSSCECHTIAITQAKRLRLSVTGHDTWHNRSLLSSLSLSLSLFFLASKKRTKNVFKPC